MPASIANSVDILAAVFDHNSNYCAVKITCSTGTYSVDWGDGTTDTGVTSNTQKDHLYSYSDADLNGSESTRGYKQALIRITPDTGNITAVNLNVRHASLTVNATTPWLDIAVNASSATVLSFYAASISAPIVERINIVAIGAVTTLANSFNSCTNLQSITFPSGSLSGVTSLNAAFKGCASLKSITFPSGSLSAVTTLFQAFSGCSSLQTVNFPAGSLDVDLTTVAEAFSACAQLKSITFPAGSLSGVTTTALMFNTCTSLQSVVFPSGALVAVTTIASMFAACVSLQNVEVPSGFGASIVTTTSAFGNCLSLGKITNCTIPVSFTAGFRLSAAALDAIYTALPTVVGQTITITGNPGASGDDPTIATAKGWTVAV
jgi:hypothetical protein